MWSSLTHSVCIPCRFTSKYWPGSCPRCGEQMLNMGKNFCPPRKSETGQWTKLQLMVDGRQEHRLRCLCSTWGVLCICQLSPRIKVKRVYKTESDVKSIYGLRRSYRKHWAREESQFRGRRSLV